jgi:hypothetical protein
VVISKSDLQTWQANQVAHYRVHAWLVVLFATVLFLLGPLVNHWLFGSRLRWSSIDGYLCGLLGGYGIGRYYGAENTWSLLWLNLGFEELSRKLKRHS